MTDAAFQLVRKEIRSLGLIYLACAVLTFLGTAVPLYYAFYGQGLLICFAAIVVTPLAGAITFAGEKERKTIQFLLALPARRNWIFGIKGLLSAVVPLVFIGGFAVLVLRVSGESNFPSMATVITAGALALFSIFAFALLFSILLDTVIIASLAGIAAASVMIVFGGLFVTLGNSAFVEAAKVVRKGKKEIVIQHVFSPLGAFYYALAILLVLSTAIGAIWLARRLFRHKSI